MRKYTTWNRKNNPEKQNDIPDNGNQHCKQSPLNHIVIHFKKDGMETESVALPWANELDC